MNDTLLPANLQKRSKHLELPLAAAEWIGKTIVVD